MILQPLHIQRYALFNRQERLVIPGGTQGGDIRLGMVLVTATQVIRKRDVFNTALPVPAHHCIGHIIERLATAGADIEDP